MVCVMVYVIVMCDSNVCVMVRVMVCVMVHLMACVCDGFCGGKPNLNRFEVVAMHLYF